MGSLVCRLDSFTWQYTCKIHPWFLLGLMVHPVIFLNTIPLHVFWRKNNVPFPFLFSSLRLSPAMKGRWTGGKQKLITLHTPYIAWCREPVVRSSTRGKGHEEGGSAYTKAGSSLRSPPGNSRGNSTPKTRVCLLSALCSHLHLWLYRGLSPTTSLWKKLTYSSS